MRPFSVPFCPDFEPALTVDSCPDSRRVSPPVKMRPRILFPARGDVRVPGNAPEGVGPHQSLREGIQRLILGIFERRIICPFELDADRKVVAGSTPVPAGHPCMPGAEMARNILDHPAVAPDQKVG